MNLNPEHGGDVKRDAPNPEDDAWLARPSTIRLLWKLFAVVLDGEVITAPRIQSPILGGSGFIEGNFTVAAVERTDVGEI